MANYDAYLLVMVLSPLIVTVTILVVSYVVWGVSYLQYKRQKRRVRENRGEHELIEYPGLQYMYLVLQPVLGKGLEARKTRHQVKMKLHGEKISPGAVPLLVQSLAVAVGLSLAVFVTVLTVEDGGRVCSERLDCFPFNYSRQVTPLTREPIRNCSAYGSGDLSIRCFSFTVRFVEALGSSGGVLVLTTLGLNLYLVLLFSLAKLGCCRRTGLCGVSLLLVFGCLVLISTLLWIIPLGLVQTRTLQYVSNWESVLVYLYTFVYLGITNTLLLYCVPNYRRDFQRCCSGGGERGYLPPQSMETDEEEEEDEERGGRGGRRRRRRSNLYQTISDRSGSQGRRARYYGSVDERRPHMPSDENHTPPSLAVGSQMRESGSPEPKTYTSKNSGGIGGGAMAGNDSGSRGKVPYRIRSVRGKYTLKHTRKPSKKRVGSGGEGRWRKHWADMDDGRRGERGREDATDSECSTTSAVLEEGDGEGEVGSGGIDTELSSEDSGETRPIRGGGGGHQKMGGAGGGQSGTAKIRAALAGDVVENDGRRGSASVHTHL